MCFPALFAAPAGFSAGRKRRIDGAGLSAREYERNFVAKVPAAISFGNGRAYNSPKTVRSARIARAFTARICRSVPRKNRSFRGDQPHPDFAERAYAVLTTLRSKWGNSDYSRLFNFRDDASTGRSMLLLNTLFSCVANIFITGTFYTGFLTANGIDIVRVGIINFIPYIAWIFSPLSPKLLSRFKRRRALLIFNHVFFYANIILATTIMPIFVTDHAMRTVWFGIFLFIGHSSNALIGSGTMAWHINFLPDGEDRNVYFSFLNLSSALAGTGAAIAASVLADSLAGSPRQAEVIVALRIASFVLFLVDGLLLYLVPREFPYKAPKKQIAVRDIVTVPLHSRKFLLTALIGMAWNVICNLNGSTWSYYILNTVGMSYTYTYIGSVVCALGSVFLLHWWRGLINRHSWFRMLFVTVLVTGLLEFPIAFTTKYTLWVFVVVSVLQGFNSVGTNLVFANMFYVNLPKDDTDVSISFWNFTMNLSVLAGSVLGTWFLSATEGHGAWTLFGLPFYGSQFLVWLKCASYLGLCWYIWKVAPGIQPDGG